MNRFGSGYEYDETEDILKNRLTNSQLSIEIQKQTKDYISQGGRISIVGQGFCKAPDLTSFSNAEASKKARKNGTRNSKLRAVK